MDLTYILGILVTVLSSVIASSGFWAYLQKKRDKKDGKTQLLIGLAHDRIIFLCMKYIERNYITQDEYENLHMYLYEPYVAMGGNGSAKRMMLEVDRLPIRNPGIHIEDAEGGTR